MRKSLIVVASALLFGVGAADVSNPKLGYDDEVFAGLVHPEQLRPRAARANYPACRPGRGDDRCIQLYERGVRARLARWDRPTGGWNGDVRMARSERRRARHARRHGAPRPHHDRQTHHGARVHEETARGGPVERRTNYPPCGARGGRDSCIQTHERSVRGERTGTPGI
jgi:hypothetical protein